MPANVEDSADLPVSLEIWHGLRNDPDFDPWCCENEGSTFELLSITETEDPNGDGLFVRRENIVASKVNPTPRAVRVFIGDEPLSFLTCQEWWREHDDREHPMRNSTTVNTPKLLKGRVTVNGEQWAQPLSDSSVRIHSKMTIVVTISGFGNTIAMLLVRQAQATLKELPNVVHKYLACKALRNSLSRMPPSPTEDGTSPRPEASMPTSPQVVGPAGSLLQLVGQPATFNNKRRCELCGERFGLYGRHHCRHCGLSVCKTHFDRPFCIPCQRSLSNVAEQISDETAHEIATAAQEKEEAHLGVRLRLTRRDEGSSGSWHGESERPSQLSLSDDSCNANNALTESSADTLCELRANQVARTDGLSTFNRRSTGGLVVLSAVVLASLSAYGLTAAILVVLAAWLGAATQFWASCVSA